MNSNAYDILRDAIINKRQVVCKYSGHSREICPHVIGMKNGRAQVLSFQFGGSSSSGLPPGGEWRCMEVDRISDAQIRDGKWHTGDRHSQRQRCVDIVDVEVVY